MMKVIVSSFILCSELDGIVDAVDRFSELYLNDFFKNKYYGEDVLEVEIHIQLIYNEYKEFDRLARPRYFKQYTTPKSGICLSAEPETWYKRFCVDTRISEEDFYVLQTVSAEAVDGILARHIYKSLDLLDKLPKRLKDFDKERFKKDVETLFHSHGWL